MKTVVLGDIHGRSCWKNIVAKENADKVVFLGDYVSTHESISEEEQINNLEDILNYKEANPDKVILLRGNHDNQGLGYSWAQCSGYFHNVAQYMTEFKDRILKDTQWIYIDGDIVYSHAGISQVWLDNCGITLEEINDKEPSEIFGFVPDSPFDNYGDSKTQSLTWIRPGALAQCNIKGYTQVVGHTPVKCIADVYKATKYHEHLWLCDNLPNEYLVVEDGEFKVVKYDNRIKLPNREGTLYLEKVDDYYKLVALDKPYILEYMRVMFDDDKSIKAIDPSGGPFMDIGYKVDNLTLSKIVFSPDLKLYFDETN